MSEYQYVSREEKMRQKKNAANRKEMIDLNQKAKAAGMSYGQYVALQMQKEEKAKREAEKLLNWGGNNA